MIERLLLETLNLAHQAQHLAPTRAPSEKQFWSFRPYQMGDPANLIDWRQSARSDTLYVREQDKPKKQSLSIWADARSFTQEKRLPILLALASLASFHDVEIRWLATPPLILKTHSDFERWAKNILSLSPDPLPSSPVSSHSWGLLSADFTHPDVISNEVWQKTLRALGSESFLALWPTDGVPSSSFLSSAHGIIIKEGAEKPLETVLKVFSLLFSGSPRLSKNAQMW